MKNTKPTQSRFYWIKLNLDFFNQDKIDFLMSQKNGANYIVLYQMLCLKTANNNGSLSSMVGDIIVPYNIDKIVRDCKYFSADTVMIALDIYKKLGLIYQGDDNVLKIADFESLVGSESESAKRMRKLRTKEKNKQLPEPPSHCDKNVTKSPSHCDEEIEIDSMFVNNNIKTPMAHAREALVDNLVQKYSDFFAVHEKTKFGIAAKELIETMVDWQLEARQMPFKFNGKTYDEKAVADLWLKIDDERLQKMFSTLVYTPEAEIEDRKRYIFGCFLMQNSAK